MNQDPYLEPLRVALSRAYAPYSNFSVGAVVRLRDPGLDDFLIAATLRGVIAQRLLRKLCLACRQGTAPDPETRQRRVIEHLVARWQQNPPPHPLIVAGSTGSRGATQLLMQKALAALPDVIAARLSKLPCIRNPPCPLP